MGIVCPQITVIGTKSWWQQCPLASPMQPGRSVDNTWLQERAAVQGWNGGHMIEGTGWRTRDGKHRKPDKTLLQGHQDAYCGSVDRAAPGTLGF